MTFEVVEYVGEIDNRWHIVTTIGPLRFESANEYFTKEAAELDKDIIERATKR